MDVLANQHLKEQNNDSPPKSPNPKIVK
jgi:hypothetical protein